MFALFNFNFMRDLTKKQLTDKIKSDIANNQKCFDFSVRYSHY